MLEKYTNGDGDNYLLGRQPEDFRDDVAAQMEEGGDPIASDVSDADDLIGEESYQEPIDEDIWDNDEDEIEDWDDFGYAAEDGSEYDEPVPFAEYDNELHDSSHVADVADADIWKRVKIDEFISGVSNVSDAERDQIAELLEDVGRSHILSWLSQYDDWTGHSLTLFLEFRIIWEVNPQWWEIRYWWRWYGGWWSHYNSGNLNRDQMRELVLRRLHCSAEEIIDEGWLADWEDDEMWRRGFPTFAGFALFRADVGEDKDWRTSLGSWEGDNQSGDAPTPYKLFSQSEEMEDLTGSSSKYRVNEDYSPHRTSRGAPQWFAIQDWYDPSEWHDNLGW